MSPGLYNSFNSFAICFRSIASDASLFTSSVANNGGTIAVTQGASVNTIPKPLI